MANGALNHCSKFAHDLNILGSKKLSSAHNSGSLFYKHRSVQQSDKIFLDNETISNTGVSGIM